MNTDKTALMLLISELELIASECDNRVNSLVDMEVSKLCSETLQFAYKNVIKMATKLLTDELNQLDNSFKDGIKWREEHPIFQFIPQISDCCNAEMIPPDLNLAEESGSLYKAFICYICTKCGKPCDPINDK